MQRGSREQDFQSIERKGKLTNGGSEQSPLEASEAEDLSCSVDGSKIFLPEMADVHHGRATKPMGYEGSVWPGEGSPASLPAQLGSI